MVFGMMLLGLTMVGQQAAVETTTQVKKCVPSKECAAKMGMTTAECKKLCKKLCTSKTAGTSSDVASANAVAELEELPELTEKKECTLSIEECAKKMGITVAECKKICAAKQSGTTSVATTQVASAEAAAYVQETESVEGKAKCVKGAKKCCKK